MVGRGPKRLDSRWVAALGGGFHSSYFSSFFLNAIFVDFLRFSRFWGTCWQAKWKPKSIFATFFPTFFRVRFGIAFLLLFGSSEPQKSCSRLDGSTIFTKSTFSKNIEKKLDFGSIFGGQNVEKSRNNDVEKRDCFEYFILCVFLRILAISARFWEAPGAPKIAKNHKKTLSGRVRSAFRIRVRF